MISLQISRYLSEIWEQPWFCYWEQRSLTEKIPAFDQNLTAKELDFTWNEEIFFSCKIKNIQEMLTISSGANRK